MTISTARYMFTAMLANDVDEEELGWQMIALMVALGFNHEAWVEVVSESMDEEEAEETFWDLHQAWPGMWIELGEDLWTITQPMIDVWKRVLGKAAA